MKNSKQKILLATIASTLTFGLTAAKVDGPSQPESPLLNVNKEAVHFSWAIDSGYTPSPKNVAASTVESVEYWQTISGSDLNRGIDINTTAPGALVRISQKANNSSNSRKASQQISGIDLLDLDITSNNKKYSNGSAMSLKASADDMLATGSPFPEGTVAFKFKDSLGQGKFTVRNKSTLPASNTYVLHVFDKASEQRLSVTREQSDYRHGETLKLQGELTNAYQGMDINSITGFVLTPNGRSLPLTIKKGVQGQFEAAANLSGATEFGALYEAYIDASSFADGIETKRRVKTAFSVTQQTASMRAVGGTINYGLPVSISAKEAGRYEVRGVLYGTAENGEMQAIMASSTAKWLESGNAYMSLQFDQNILAKSPLKAPFEVRHLELIDQSRLGSLQLEEKFIGISGIRPDRLIDSEFTNRMSVEELKISQNNYRQIAVTQGQPQRTGPEQAILDQINDKR